MIDFLVLSSYIMFQYCTSFSRQNKTKKKKLFLSKPPSLSILNANAKTLVVHNNLIINKQTLCVRIVRKMCQTSIHFYYITQYTKKNIIVIVMTIIFKNENKNLNKTVCRLNCKYIQKNKHRREKCVPRNFEFYNKPFGLWRDMQKIHTK